MRHSQNMVPPKCPNDFKQLYTGYSLVFTQGYGMTLGQHLSSDNVQTELMIYLFVGVGQDLGKTGSCVQQFTTAPALACTRDDCDTMSRTGQHRYALLRL